MFKKIKIISLHAVVRSLKLSKNFKRKKDTTGKVTVFQLVTTYIESRHKLSTVSHNIPTSWIVS